MIPAAPADPVTTSQSGAQNRVSTEVLARNSWISAGRRLSTSSARKSTMNRLLPVNCRMKACGDGWPRSEMAARYTPAGQPSVRSMS